MADKIISPFIDIENKELPMADLLSMSTNGQQQTFQGSMGVAGNIIVYDNNNARVLVGYQKNGF